MVSSTCPRRRNLRKGALIPLAALMMVFLVVCVAFAIDVGYLCVVRTQAQQCADAAALAGAWAMVSDKRVEGRMQEVYTAARAEAAEFARLNTANARVVTLDLNASNDPEGEIVLGRLDNPADRSETLSLSDPCRYNTVLVRVGCLGEKGNAVPLFFARVLGLDSADVTAQAATIFEDSNTEGFRVTDRTGNCKLLPFVVKVEDWRALLASGREDRWTYDPASRKVSPGSDGIPELKLYPQQDKENRGDGMGTGITPGNFGKVDIGAHDNNRQDLFRQIRDGVSARDLAAHGGELKLDPGTGTLQLNGDLGITAGMQHALAEIVGQPRAILLYSDVTGQGHQTWFTVCGFVSVRVVDFKMTGGNKYIQVQPAVVVDPTAISGNRRSSYFVGQPVHLVR